MEVVVDWDDPTIEAAWLGERRKEIRNYLANEGMLHGDVAQAPSWFAAPYVSIWKVLAGEGARLWLWAVAGDLPCDFIASDYAVDAREAMRTFAARWLAMADSMASGQVTDLGTIGAQKDWPVLAPLLRSRAALMRTWADDHGMWSATS
jgi:hypothetical protein